MDINPQSSQGITSRMLTADTAALDAPAADERTWKPLRVLCGYRLVVALLLVSGFVIDQGERLFPIADPALFLRAAALYLLLAAVATTLAFARRPAFLWQVHGQVLLDTLCLATLIHAGGELFSGLGMFMLVAVAGASLLVGVRLAAYFAAIATLALFGQQGLSHAEGIASSGGYTQAAVVGLAIFATAIGGSLLARRARASEALAEARGVDVANLEALNAHIVQRMDTGIIALDPAGRVRLINRAARQLLGHLPGGTGGDLGQLSPALEAAYRQWRDHWDSSSGPLAGDGAEYLPRFQPIGRGGHSGTLVFLENLSEMRAQVQQAKLASLGRLTASIAHEIRNPLGAMLQAAQLLGEADYLQRGEQRLVGIIGKQGRRLNQTIENVLQLSRRAPASRRPLALDGWLQAFAEEWRESLPPGLTELHLALEVDPAEGLFDPDHLRQIIDNLMRNAVDHAGAAGPPTVRLACGAGADGRPWLEIQDNGPGIPGEIRERLFEPFATTSPSGTGLGLYLVRELCEANQATVTLDTEREGACFRLHIAAARGRGDAE